MKLNADHDASSRRALATLQLAGDASVDPSPPFPTGDLSPPLRTGDGDCEFLWSFSLTGLSLFCLFIIAMAGFVMTFVFSFI
nr:hypothetical protein CFP56_70903 [Quercus suber]